ncbi:MAG: ATPase, T2SS/T4P/T4SS family [Pirellulales bacterium]
MLASALRQLDPTHPQYAAQFVELVLRAARESGASDVHLQPTPTGLELAWRLDGVLHPLGCFPPGQTADVVTRLKVLAQLLTYRVDIPQEGRVHDSTTGKLPVGAQTQNEPAGASQWRVSTFPTLHGERAVVRQVSGLRAARELADLRLPATVEATLTRLMQNTSGAVLLTGPAGSGKTTTAYGCLRAVVGDAVARRCVVTLEDPIEAPLAGVVQAQIQPSAGFDLATGLRSILRQDPEVILVGEIRDRETAEGVFNAALTGHLLLSTFHAGSAAGAIARLSEMGIEPYLLRSGLLAVVHQRLLRRLCSCATLAADDDPSQRLGYGVGPVWRTAGCSECQQTGYRGRLVLAELLLTENSELGRAILSRDDAARLEQLARQGGLVPIYEQAVAAIRDGLTTPIEVRRVLGGER